MKAVVYKKPYSVAVEDVEKPSLVEPTDAVLRLTTAAICGSDLHMYEGRTPMTPGQTLGHENLGIIESVGTGCRVVKPGDRVVLPFNIGCGFCFNCSRGFANACLTANPESAGAGYGYSGLGPHGGGQAEFLRVPYADFNCLLLPGVAGDELEDDFVMLADVFPTGYHATEQAHVRPGDSVAIFGAGPVGLMAAISARLKGASEIYVVDDVPERLALATQIGAPVVAVDSGKGDAVEQILDLRAPQRRVQNLQPGAGDKMPGVMCGIDAVGYQANERGEDDRSTPHRVLADVVKVTNPTGHVGLIGAYFPADPGAPDARLKAGEYTLPLGLAWNKGISIEMGQAPVKRYNVYLRDLIVAGVVRPSMIVSHRLPLAEAPDAYDKFDKRTSGYTKVVLKPGASFSPN